MDMFSRVVWVGLALGGCVQERATSASKATGVRWFGTLHAVIHEGRTGAAVKLADVVPGPHAWGVGALEGLNGEVTVVDDVAWLARSRGDGTSATLRADLGGADASQGAALFVVASVGAWEAIDVTKDVPWSELDGFLASELRARGRALDVPVALRIDGPVASLRWHVVDGSKLDAGASHAEHIRAGATGELEQASVQLVGFFSTAHEGVFTHAGSSSHFHVLAQSPLVSGHVDGVDLLRGAHLFVAKP